MECELNNIENEIKQQIVLTMHNYKPRRYSFRKPELPLNELLSYGKPMDKIGLQGAKGEKQ